MPRMGLWLVVGLVSGGCGARSGLEVLPPCEVEGDRQSCETICGSGVEYCVAGHWQGCDAPRPLDRIVLEGTVRDFRDSHPDFESFIAFDPDLGIVADELGADGKPVYAGSPATDTTSGRSNFDQWYRDVDGVNAATAHNITLTRVSRGDPLYRLNDPSFFPIDDRLFGNEGRDHNFHFTFEVQTEFRFVGGETFRFRGDDDLWFFVNDHLALDLGGVHPTAAATVSLDDIADQLEIEPGGIYPIAFFFAERHTDGSSFRIETTIAEFRSCPAGPAEPR